MNCPVKMNDNTPCPPECKENKGEPTFSEVCRLLNQVLQKTTFTETEMNFAKAFRKGNKELTIELYNQIRGKIDPLPQ